MRAPVLILLAFLNLLVGCKQNDRERMRPYEEREIKCIQDYGNGDIATARQSLLNYIQLIEEEETSGLPFKKTSYSKALGFARLTLICRELGEHGLADQYFRQTIVYTKKDAQESQKEKLWLDGKSDEQIGSKMLNWVSKLDEENIHPKWKQK